MHVFSPKLVAKHGGWLGLPAARCATLGVGLSMIQRNKAQQLRRPCRDAELSPRTSTSPVAQLWPRAAGKQKRLQWGWALPPAHCKPGGGAGPSQPCAIPPSCSRSWAKQDKGQRAPNQSGHRVDVGSTFTLWHQGLMHHSPQGHRGPGTRRAVQQSWALPCAARVPLWGVAAALLGPPKPKLVLLSAVSSSASV